MLTSAEKTELLTIKRDVVTRDTDGSEIRTPSTLATRYASIQPISGREWFAAQQTQSSATYRVRMDYMETVKASDYIEWGSLTLQIVGTPMQDRAGWETVLMCAVRNG